MSMINDREYFRFLFLVVALSSLFNCCLIPGNIFGKKKRNMKVINCTELCTASSANGFRIQSKQEVCL